MINPIVSVILGIYLLRIALNGRAGELLDKLKGESDFLRWALAIALLDTWRKADSQNEYGIVALESLVFIAMGLTVAANGQQLEKAGSQLVDLITLRGVNK